MSRNPFCGPRPCYWPCGPAPVDCLLLLDDFDSLDDWEVVTGTPSAVGSNLELPAGLQRVRTKVAHPDTPANFYSVIARDPIGGASLGTDLTFSVAVTDSETGDYSSGVEARAVGDSGLADPLLLIYRNGTELSSTPLPKTSSLLSLSLCGDATAIRAIADTSLGKIGLRYPITVPGGSAPGGSFMYIESNHPFSTVTVPSAVYSISNDPDLYPHCPICEKIPDCPHCNAETEPDIIPARMTQWANGTCTDCGNLNGDVWLPRIASCIWELRDTVTLCGELCDRWTRAVSTGNGWDCFFQVNNASYTIFYQMNFRESSGIGTGDCSAERIIPNDSQTASGNCGFPLFGTMVLNADDAVPPSSVGAMRAPGDCPPIEIRRGKPVVPKGKLPKG